MDFPSWIIEHTQKLEAEGLLRRPQVLPRSGAQIVVQGRAALNFASNDYLGLASDERLKAAVVATVHEQGVGSASARLLSGTTVLHASLESALSEFFRRGSAVLYSSGYLANIGAIAAGRGRRDIAFSDRLAHASLVDGIRLSGMKHHRFRHNDLNHLESLLKNEHPLAGRGRLLVVTESVFSMNGDLAPLEELSKLAQRYDADLLVDEAHGVGVFPCGRFGDIMTGTLSKAFGSYGGIVLGVEGLASFLHSLSRSFLFNTSLPPAICAASLEALRIVQDEPELGGKLLKRAERFRARLETAGLDCLGSQSQIVPVLVGDREKAKQLSEALLERGIFAPHIRPPTVPPGADRIRFSLTLGISETELASAAEEIVSAACVLELC